MADSKEITISVSSEIRVTYKLPYANAKPDTFSVPGNKEHKDKSYPLIAAYFRRKFERQIDPDTVTVEDYLPDQIDSEAFDNHCKVSFWPRKQRLDSGETVVIADLEYVEVYSFANNNAN